jgi:hypothetical protein
MRVANSRQEDLAMREPTLDPTAGERARAIRAHPGAFHAIVDPTDPRYREASPTSQQATAGANPIFDPTDPDCGRRAE